MVCEDIDNFKTGKQLLCLFIADFDSKIVIESEMIDSQKMVASVIRYGSDEGVNHYN